MAIINRAFDISGRCSTGDPNLACALLSNSVCLDLKHPCDKIKGDSGDYLRFHFMPSTIDGTRTTAELCAAWRAGEDHIRRFPDDGMSYCIAYSLNRVSLLDFIHKQTPQIIVRKGKQIALISENAGSRMEGEILGRMR